MGKVIEGSGRGSIEVIQGIVVLALLERLPCQFKLKWECRLHCIAPTSLNGVLAQSFSTKRMLILCSFTQESTRFARSI